MKIHDISNAPQAIGPYCHAMQVGNLVFCSGQTPLDPQTGQLVGSDIGQQTERVLQNLEIVLNGLGLSLVSAVVDQHRGTLAFADNQPGLKVTLELPRRDPGASPATH